MSQTWLGCGVETLPVGGAFLTGYDSGAWFRSGLSPVSIALVLSLGVAKTLK